MAGTAIDAYLLSEPYYGNSNWQDREIVKRKCGPTRCYDSSLHLWGTKSIEDLQNLVASRLWHPIGIEPDWLPQLLRDSHTFRAAQEASWIAKHAKHTPKEKSWTQKIQKLPKTSKLCKATPAPKPAEPYIDKNKPKRPPKVVAKPIRPGALPTPHEVEECKRLGFTQRAITFGISCDDFGARSSLSPEGRLLRWCLYIDHDDYLNSDDPSQKHISGSRYFNSNSGSFYDDEHKHDAAKRGFALELDKKCLASM